MSEILYATKVKRTEFAGAGCLLQGLGLVLSFFWFPVGLVVGVGLFVFGSLRSSYWACGHCRNRLSDREVRICPACHATLLGRR